ncbi:hypothetical protein CHU98_g6134 [Xylaria longipes]|nr:hypothetical protein CHU98_g6134 [Xylaria longipes]
MFYSQVSKRGVLMAVTLRHYRSNKLNPNRLLARVMDMGKAKVFQTVIHDLIFASTVGPSTQNAYLPSHDTGNVEAVARRTTCESQSTAVGSEDSIAYVLHIIYLTFRKHLTGNYLVQASPILATLLMIDNDIFNHSTVATREPGAVENVRHGAELMVYGLDQFGELSRATGEWHLNVIHLLVLDTGQARGLPMTAGRKST